VRRNRWNWLGQEAVFLASHCAVLTAGPARMAEYFPIDLPFPRAADQDHGQIRRLCAANLREPWGLVRALKFGDIAGPGAKVGNAPHREIRNA
jgi:hypothetical protein